MATMKRRVLYLTDEEWQTAVRLAKEHGVTASYVMRLMLDSKRVVAEFEQAMRNFGEVMESTGESLEQMADAMRAIAPERYDQRPIRPVPKTRK